MSPAVINTDPEDEVTERRVTGREIRRMKLVRARLEIVGWVLLCLLVLSVLIGNILITRKLYVVTSACCPAAVRYYEGSQPTVRTGQP